MSQPARSYSRRGLVDYTRFAVDLPALDSRLAVRVLRETVLQARDLTRQDELDRFHREPPPTGSRGWDSLLAGVACMTGVRAAAGVLDWCFRPERYCVELFDPLDTGKYRWLDALRTPVEIRTRNVILAAGNLEGV
ncbi:hypothetical protein HH308_04340 [Gordonia sp. TBRC 11910]|uniref:Uncharacterized protein n=1 Tax=Gordonia asplenii TaxID=2725283 RepID=A0A848KW92_9ACTN|nr:hypothetical protein [Gordonia asplenii]NMO00441.1 hypothetical protein [Gordonia asplenii]